MWRIALDRPSADVCVSGVKLGVLLRDGHTYHRDTQQTKPRARAVAHHHSRTFYGQDDSDLTAASLQVSCPVGRRRSAGASSWP